MTLLSGRSILMTTLGGFAAVSVLVNVHALQSIRIDGSTRLLDGSMAAGIEKDYRDSVFFKDPATTFFGTLRYLAFNEGLTGVVVGKDGWLFSTEELERPAGYEARAGQLIQDVVEDARQMEQAGAQVVVALLPPKADVYAEKLPFSAEKAVTNLSYDEVRRHLRESGLQVPDLRAALRQAKGRGEVFFRTDTHWTPLGAAAAAEALSASLDGVSLGERRSYSVKDGEPVSFEGDLLRYVPLGGLAKLVGFVPEDVAPPVVDSPAGEPSAADLFGGSEIPVNLVGTSYSANENWGFVSSLKRYLGADVLNLAEVGQGPFRPMDSYLQSGTFSKSEPRLVIWEIPLRYFAVSPQPAKNHAHTEIVSASVRE